MGANYYYSIRNLFRFNIKMNDKHKHKKKFLINDKRVGSRHKSIKLFISSVLNH